MKNNQKSDPHLKRKHFTISGMRLKPKLSKEARQLIEDWKNALLDVYPTCKASINGGIERILEDRKRILHFLNGLWNARCIVRDYLKQFKAVPRMRQCFAACLAYYKATCSDSGNSAPPRNWISQGNFFDTFKTVVSPMCEYIAWAEENHYRRSGKPTFEYENFEHWCEVVQEFFIQIALPDPMTRGGKALEIYNKALLLKAWRIVLSGISRRTIAELDSTPQWIEESPPGTVGSKMIN